MTTPATPLTFTRGPAMANRMMLAPLTNMQSHADGTLSDDEIKWLTMRATGGMGLVMTAAAGHSPKKNQPSAVAQIIVEYSKGATSEASASR